MRPRAGTTSPATRTGRGSRPTQAGSRTRRWETTRRSAASVIPTTGRQSPTTGSAIGGRDDEGGSSQWLGSFLDGPRRVVTGRRDHGAGGADFGPAPTSAVSHAAG